MHEDRVQDQLIYSTVRIKTSNSSSASMGTGFFVTKQYENGIDNTVIVTNKHVVDGYDHAEIILCEADANNNPIDDQRVMIKIHDLQSKCVGHPDENVDLCFLKIGDVNQYLKNQGKRAFYKCIGLDFFEDTEAIDSLTPIENVIMIGYPESLMDEKNNKPVVRKGITASSITLDYNEKKEFLIDIACFPGSSGSPIFLERTGLLQKEDGNGFRVSVNYWYSLLGVVYAVPVMTVKGDIKMESVPTTNRLYSETQRYLNLGYVIKADRIKELFEIIEQEDVGNN